MKNFTLAMIGAALLSSLWCMEPSSAQEGADPDRRIGVLLAAGDIAGCFQADRDYQKVAELIQKEIDKAGQRPLAVLVLGDVAYSNRTAGGNLASPSYADCLADFKATWGVHHERLLPVPGNHDYSDDPDDGAAFQDHFRDTLSALNADEASLFYATNFPPGHPDAWLLAAINFYRDRNRQQDLLRSALQNSTTKCALIFSHPFLHSSGNHGRRLTNWTYERMQPFMDIAAEQGATLLVTAHDHDYERFARQDAAGNEAAKGVGTFVVGTGGAHLYSVPDENRHPLSRAFQNDDAGVLKIEIYPDRYTSSFLAIDGSVFDAVSEPQECSPRPPQ